MQEQITLTEAGGKLVCTLAGHFDTVQSQKLQDLLRARLAMPQPVVFDLAGVTFVCSAFLRVCLLAAKTAGTTQFAILGLTPPIKRVFKIAGMTELFTCE